MTYNAKEFTKAITNILIPNFHPEWEKDNFNSLSTKEKEKIIHRNILKIYRYILDPDYPRHEENIFKAMQKYRPLYKKIAKKDDFDEFTADEIIFPDGSCAKSLAEYVPLSLRELSPGNDILSHLILLPIKNINEKIIQNKTNK